MKKRHLIIFLAGLSICSGAIAQAIYLEDFTSMPSRRRSTVPNSNYAGTGESLGTHLHANGWMYSSKGGMISHDTGNKAADVDLGHNICHLIDLSNPLSDPGTETNFFLSFDVLNISGEVSLFAFAGGGLDYNGTGEGHVLFRTYGNPCLFDPKNGATGTQVIDGAATIISATGHFQVPITTANVGNSGDYLFIAFANSGKSLTIDNLKIELPVELPTLTVQVPVDVATEAPDTPGTIRISRGGNTSGDLDVSYSLSGTADSSDYAETHAGTVTIPDGSVSVDLPFTPVDDGVFEGYETVQLELTADAAYVLGEAATGSITISDVTFQGDTMALGIAPDGGVSLLRDRELVSTSDSQGWSIYNWFNDIRIPLNTVISIDADTIQLESADGQYQVEVDIVGNDRYFKFELIYVSNTFGGALDDDWPGHRVEFNLQVDAQDDGWKLNTILLNPMSELNTRSPWSIGNNSTFYWPYPQWAQTTDRPQPQGMIGVFGFTSDTEHDDILADIWAAEPSLPRPNRANQSTWTKADVLAWVDRWVVEQGYAKRMLSVDPSGSYESLMAITHLAGQAGMNHVYLSQHSWQDDNIGDFNSSLFPQGVADAEVWKTLCDSYGIGISFHGFSHLIRKVDPYYGRGVVHDELARSAAGTLLEDVPAEAKGYTFLVQPDWDYYLGMKEGMLPFYNINDLDPPQDFNGGLGGTFPPYYEGMRAVINLNKNLYKCSVSLTASNQWQVTLADDAWARVSTTPLVNHYANDPVDFILQSANGGYYLPDSRSQLLVDQAIGYADLLNVVQTGAGYDGSAWTEDFGSWGLRRFSQEVVERMDHPAGGGSALGIMLFGHFEHQFKRVQALSGVVANIPVELNEQSHLSSSLDQASRAATKSAASRHIGLRSTHSGLSLNTIENHGHWNEFGGVLQIWSELKPELTPAQVDLVSGAADHYYVASETAGQWQLMQAQAMRRPGIDGGWNVQAERPEIAPRQFFKADDETLSGLNNPYAAQAPVVELHVMAGMSDTDPANTSLMPTSAGDIINPVDAEQTLGYDSGNLTVSVNNSGSSQAYEYYARNDTVGYWLRSINMSASRGLAITVNGDGSGSTLVVSTGGFPRMYAVDIDFVGVRTIEIPNGEVCNNRDGWDTFQSGSITQFDYSKVDRFRLFLHKVPAGINCSVEVLDIQTLNEDRTTGLIDPVLTLNSDSVSVQGTVSYNNYLVYKGGSTAEVYDPNWNFVENLSVTGTGLTAVNGSGNTFSVLSAATNTWLSSRIKVEDSANIITLNKPAGFDGDGDGIADTDEAGYGTDYNNADTDGDGFGDGYEVQKGYLPTSPVSTPEMYGLIQAEDGGQTVTVSFEAAHGQTYTLYRSDDLATWTPVEEAILGEGDQIIRSYPTSEADHRFFRAVRE